LAITRVQGNARGTSTSNSISVTMGSTPTSGNILVATIGIKDLNTYRTVSSISQTGCSWTRQVSKTSYSTDYFDVEIWFGVVSSGASASITITLTGTATCSVADVCEYSGVLTTGFLDKTASATGYSNTPQTGTTATTTQANELWIGSTIVRVGAAQSNPANGFTLLDGTNYSSMSLAYLEKIVSSTGQASSGTSTASTWDWAGCIATFKASAAPPVGIASKRLLVGVGL